MERNDLAMMKNRMQWPHLVLPVKKRAPIGEFPTDKLGILMGDKPMVYLCNMFMIPEDLSQCPRIAYKSYEEIVADGWIVD